MFVCLEDLSKQLLLFYSKQKEYHREFSPDEEVMRKNIFQRNLVSITDHNRAFAAGKTTTMRHIDEFTDRHDAEVRSPHKSTHEIKLKIPNEDI